MGENSKIEWCTHTFNPWLGCTKVSDGCKFCYAETLTKGRMQLNVWGPKAERRARVESAWSEPLRWDRAAAKLGERHRVFCASLADVFEGPDTCQDKDAYDVVSAGRARLWATINATPNLDWLLLTKRPENIEQFMPWLWRGEFPANVWIGTSVEDVRVTGRVDELRKYLPRVRFLSIEPLIGPLPYLNLDGIGWVIVGGESGPHARPMHPDWARSLRDQCVEAGVPFFFKQFGEYGPLAATKANGAYDLSTAIIMANDGTVYHDDDLAYPNGKRYGEAVRAGHDKAHLTTLYRVGKKIAGRLLDGRTWDELPCVESEPAA